MASITVTGLTAARMMEIEQASIITGRIEGDNLILTTKGGENVDAGHIRGLKGPRGRTGSSFWTTEMALTPGVTTNVVPDNIPENELQVGDLIMSTALSTNGYLAKVVSNTPEENATVLYLGNLRGPGGGSQEGFDWMFEEGMNGWVSNTTITLPEAEAGDEAEPRLITASILKRAVWSFVTGSATTAVSTIGQALNRAANAKAARDAIGAADSEETQTELDKKPNSNDIRDFEVLSRTQYNNLNPKVNTTMYFVWG